MKKRRVKTYRKSRFFGKPQYVSVASGGGARKVRAKASTAEKARQRLKDKETERQINS